MSKLADKPYTNLYGLIQKNFGQVFNSIKQDGRQLSDDDASSQAETFIITTFQATALELAESRNNSFIWRSAMAISAAALTYTITHYGVSDDRTLFAMAAFVGLAIDARAGRNRHLKILHISANQYCITGQQLNPNAKCDPVLYQRAQDKIDKAMLPQRRSSAYAFSVPAQL